MDGHGKVHGAHAREIARYGERARVDLRDVIVGHGVFDDARPSWISRIDDQPDLRWRGVRAAGRISTLIWKWILSGRNESGAIAGEGKCDINLGRVGIDH